MTIPAQLLETDVGGLVELFDIDMTPISATAPTIFITPATENAPPAEIARGGQTYTPCPVAVEGMERGGTGALPTPTLTVANVAQMVSPWVEGGQDMLGALVTRTVVLAAWLDGGSAADSTAAISSETYAIEQKTAQAPTHVSFLLRSPLESRLSIPSRKAFPRCGHTYRIWNAPASGFDAGTCPYAAASYFDQFNASTGVPANDFCSRRLSSCLVRFGSSALPFLGFPSLDGA